MSDLSWLVERPIAHRGLHDAARGVAENSILAARAAIDAGYAIECDVQLSKDGEAVVFHDDRLDRLTGASGQVKEQSVERLAQLTSAGDERDHSDLRELFVRDRQSRRAGR